MNKPYKRIVIKLSGEGLTSKDEKLAVDPKVVAELAKQVKAITSQGVQVAIVVGGGNFWRGASAERNGIPRNRADYIGMLATLMNALALQSGFELLNVKVRVQSALRIDSKVSENYVLEKAVGALEKGEVVIFGGGTGRPYFTTDTTATLVASELKADIILLGKNGVDGIYDADPRLNPRAKKFTQITWDEVLTRKLGVMDATAASMARDNNLKLICFDINEADSLIRAVKGDIAHTIVTR